MRKLFSRFVYSKSLQSQSTHQKLREPDKRGVRVVALPLLDHKRVIPVARGGLRVVIDQNDLPEISVDGAEVLLVAAVDVPGGVAKQLVHQELQRNCLIDNLIN